MRPKQCKVCHATFTPVKMGQKVCSVECAYTLAKSQRAKQEKKHMLAEVRRQRKLGAERRESLKTRSEWQKEAQAAFNAFIRARDADKPCICCGLPLHSGDVGGSFDCGHYRSVGSAPHLRFHEDNAHGQRKQCNRWGAGRAVDYRLGLIARIGLDRVEALESDQEPRHYTIDDLKAIKAEYKRKALEIRRG